ncbi:hypothetical protein EST38_g9467 [Candolleomyces aberdarensis]|uniref:MYND-type domain-containing protein n=1 Tax=Candolleomyces aberdarensis TaxID=2316362 RepID=A0A4Q2DC66_9AGAR|nr:hypothetical protein EST38_g9467 [Candolleomyces aberdarensis]
MLVYINAQPVPEVYDISHMPPHEFRKLLDTVDAYMFALVAAIDKFCTPGVDASSALSNHFLKYHPRLFEWCLFFSANIMRMTFGVSPLDATIHKVSRVVSRLLSLGSSQLRLAVSSSEDAAETMINLWNVGDDVSHSRDAIIDISFAFNNFLSAENGTATTFKVIERLPLHVVKLMVQTLESRYREIQFGQMTPPEVPEAWEASQHFLRVLQRQPRFYEGLNRYFDWKCILSTAMAAVFGDTRSVSLRSDTSEEPVTSLLALIQAVLFSGNSVIGRLVSLFDEFTLNSGRQTRNETLDEKRQKSAPCNLIDYVTFLFKRPSKSEAFVAYFRWTLTLLDSHAIYPPVTKAIAEEERWSVYRQFYEDPQNFNMTVTFCDNLNHGETLIPHDYLSRACSGCRYAVYCSPICQKQDWEARHRDECMDAGAIHAGSRRDHRWLSPFLRHQILAYIMHFVNHDLSLGLLDSHSASLLNSKTDRLTSTSRRGDLAGVKNPKLKGYMDEGLLWLDNSKIPGQLEAFRLERFGRYNLDQLVIHIKLDSKCLGVAVALEDTLSFWDKMMRQENGDVDSWMKRRLAAIFFKQSELNKHQAALNSTTKFVLLNVEASLGNEIWHLVVLSQARTRTMDGSNEWMKKGDMDFKIVNVFYFPTRSKTGLLAGM